MWYLGKIQFCYQKAKTVFLPRKIKTRQLKKEIGGGGGGGYHKRTDFWCISSTEKSRIYWTVLLADLRGTELKKIIQSSVHPVSFYLKPPLPTSERGKDILVQFVHDCIKCRRRQVQSSVFSHTMKPEEHCSHCGSVLQRLWDDKDATHHKTSPTTTTSFCYTT